MHDNDTTERQYAFRKEGVAPALTLGLALVGMLFAMWLALGRQPTTPAAEFYRPDPTPWVVDNSVEVNIFSGNKFFSDNQTCIGDCK